MRGPENWALGMSNNGLVELSLVFGIVLALSLWELWSVRKSLEADRQNKRDRSREGQSSDPPD